MDLSRFDNVQERADHLLQVIHEDSYVFYRAPLPLWQETWQEAFNISHKETRKYWNLDNYSMIAAIAFAIIFVLTLICMAFTFPIASFLRTNEIMSTEAFTLWMLASIVLSLGGIAGALYISTETTYRSIRYYDQYEFFPAMEVLGTLSQSVVLDMVVDFGRNPAIEQFTEALSSVKEGRRGGTSKHRWTWCEGHLDAEGFQIHFKMEEEKQETRIAAKREHHQQFKTTSTIEITVPMKGHPDLSSYTKKDHSQSEDIKSLRVIEASTTGVEGHVRGVIVLRRSFWGPEDLPAYHLEKADIVEAFDVAVKVIRQDQAA